MSVNSSSSTTNASLPPSLNSTPSRFYTCSDSVVGSHIFTAFACAYFMLVIPLSVLVFNVALRRRRRQRSVSHSDVYTYHMVIMELIGFLGSFFYSCGIYIHLPLMNLGGVYILFVVFLGRLLLNCLTCVDRYLAVVHPIIYLGLKKAAGVRIRNISIGGVWLLCFGWVGVTSMYSPNLPVIPFFCIFGSALLLISFCSLSVLHTLNQSRPGGKGGDRERGNQSKKRAFNTIMAVMGALVFKYVVVILFIGVRMSHLLSYDDGCVLALSAFWSSLPNSVVLPLLFLHRAGRLACCRHDVESR